MVDREGCKSAMRSRDTELRRRILAMCELDQARGRSWSRTDWLGLPAAFDVEPALALVAEDERLGPRPDVKRILGLLETPVPHRGPVLHYLESVATVFSLRDALLTTTQAATRVMLCYLLGQRNAMSSASALTRVLGDTDSSVRHAAADALSRLFWLVDERTRTGDRASAALLRQLHVERDPAVRLMIVEALGSVRCSRATSTLSALSKTPDKELRDFVNLSLKRIREPESQSTSS